MCFTAKNHGRKKNGTRALKGFSSKPKRVTAFQLFVADQRATDPKKTHQDILSIWQNKLDTSDKKAYKTRAKRDNAQQPKVEMQGKEVVMQESVASVIKDDDDDDKKSEE